MELLLQRIILKNYNIGFLLIKGSGFSPGVLSSLPKKEGKEHGVQYEKARYLLSI